MNRRITDKVFSSSKSLNMISCLLLLLLRANFSTLVVVTSEIIKSNEYFFLIFRGLKKKKKSLKLTINDIPSCYHVHIWKLSLSYKRKSFFLFSPDVNNLSIINCLMRLRFWKLGLYLHKLSCLYTYYTYPCWIIQVY